MEFKEEAWCRRRTPNGCSMTTQITPLLRALIRELSTNSPTNFRYVQPATLALRQLPQERAAAMEPEGVLAAAHTRSLSLALVWPLTDLLHTYQCSSVRHAAKAALNDAADSTSLRTHFVLPPVFQMLAAAALVRNPQM